MRGRRRREKAERKMKRESRKKGERISKKIESEFIISHMENPEGMKAEKERGKEKMED